MLFFLDNLIRGLRESPQRYLRSYFFIRLFLFVSATKTEHAGIADGATVGTISPIFLQLITWINACYLIRSVDYLPSWSYSKVGTGLWFFFQSVTASILNSNVNPPRWIGLALLLEQLSEQAKIEITVIAPLSLDLLCHSVHVDAIGRGFLSHKTPQGCSRDYFGQSDLTMQVRLMMILNGDGGGYSHLQVLDMIHPSITTPTPRKSSMAVGSIRSTRHCVCRSLSRWCQRSAYRFLNPSSIRRFLCLVTISQIYLTWMADAEIFE